MPDFNEDDEDDAVACYVLDEHDQRLLTLAARLLEGAVQEPSTEWAVRVSIAKLLHVICRLPNASTELSVEVTISSPRKRYGEATIYFSLSVGVQDTTVHVRYGGHYHHPRSGGDSFTVFSWCASPGETPDWDDYGEGLEAVTGLVNPVDVLHAMPGALGLCEIHVSDEENTLLGDEPMEPPPCIAAPSGSRAAQSSSTGSQSSDDSNDGVRPKEAQRAMPSWLNPITEADHQLLAKAGKLSEPTGASGQAYGIENCDGCGIDLATVGLLVDGASPRSGWGNYCAECCLRHSVAVGWGKGQLYARQHDGKWIGVAGFTR